jgi:hypothetical protein
MTGEFWFHLFSACVTEQEPEPRSEQGTVVTEQEPEPRSEQGTVVTEQEPESRSGQIQ